MFDNNSVFLKFFLHKLQANYPARVKQIHMYNTGAFMDLVMTVIKFCTPEKLQQRVCYSCYYAVYFYQ